MRKSTLVVTCSLIATFIFISIPGKSVAQDDFSFEGDKWNGDRFQIGLRAAYRMDDTKSHDYQPSGGVRLFYWAKPWMAWILSGNYASQSEFGTRTSYENLLVDFCWRMQRPEKLISPFFEAGPSVARYWVKSRGYKMNDSELGLRLAVGLELKLSGSSSIELNVSQLLNRTNQYVYTLGTPVVAPCQEGTDCGYTSWVPNDVYNEANFEMTFRFGL